MKQPTNNIQEILYTAIKKGSVSLIDFPYLSGFRTRISELRSHIVFKEEAIKARNKFNREIRYQNHILTDIEKAKSVYNLMTRL